MPFSLLLLSLLLLFRDTAFRNGLPPSLVPLSFTGSPQFALGKFAGKGSDRSLCESLAHTIAFFGIVNGEFREGGVEELLSGTDVVGEEGVEEWADFTMRSAAGDGHAEDDDEKSPVPAGRVEDVVECAAQVEWAAALGETPKDEDLLPILLELLTAFAWVLLEEVENLRRRLPNAGVTALL